MSFRDPQRWIRAWVQEQLVASARGVWRRPDSRPRRQSHLCARTSFNSCHDNFVSGFDFSSRQAQIC